MPQAGLQGKTTEGGGEKPGSEGITGACGRHDVDMQGGDEGARLRSRPGVGAARPHVRAAALRRTGAARSDTTARRLRGAGRDQPPPARSRHEGRGPHCSLLHHQHSWLGQRGPNRRRPARDPPRLLRLVLPHEHDVGSPSQLQQHPRTFGIPPQAGPVVDVEGHQRPVLTRRHQRTQQRQTPLRQRRRDPRQMQHPSRPHRRQVHVLHRHRRRGRPRPVVRDLMGVRRPVPRRTEVHPRRTPGIPPHGGDIDPVPPDRLDQVIPEPVRPHPADPPNGMAGSSQPARHVRLRPADRPVEGRHVGEPARTRGQERDHGLAERDDVHDVGGIHDGRSSSSMAEGHGGSIDPALAWMLDSSKRYTQWPLQIPQST